MLHPARAAQSGLEAVLLAKAGMRGSAEILNAKDGGIYPMMSREYNYAEVDKDLGSVWEIFMLDKKPYPCCRSTHCGIDAAIRLGNREHLDPEKIRDVTIQTYLVGLKQCGLSETSLHPVTAAQAKFSTPYTAACAFLRGNVSLSDFTDTSIMDPARRKLMEKIHVAEDPELTKLYPNSWGCRMQVTMEDGKEYQVYIPSASGSVTTPLSKDRLWRKATACLEDYPAAKVQTFLSTVEDLENREALPSTTF